MQLTIFADWKIYLISQYRRIDQIVIDPSCRYAALKVRGATPGTGHAKGRAETRAHLRRNIVRFGSLLLSSKLILPRKEVIQPHVPVRLPCYDFTPLTLHTFGASPLAVGHADPRLLATPTSWGRVAAPNPNWGRLSGIRSGSRHRIPLYRPL